MLKLKFYLNRIIKFLLQFTTSREFSDIEISHILWISKIHSMIKNIPGHIAEIGVAEGRNAILFGKLIRMNAEEKYRQYIGFDTFDGFIKSDLESDKHLDKNDHRNISKEKVWERFKLNNVERICEIIKGDANITVPKTLRSHKGYKFMPGYAKFALLYIDCNSTATSLKCMEEFYDYMMPGAFIVIDETVQGGETKALTTFAKSKNLEIKKLGIEMPMCVEIPKK